MEHEFLKNTVTMPVCPEMQTLEAICRHFQAIADNAEESRYPYKINIETIRSEHRMKYIVIARYYISYYLVDVCGWPLQLCGYWMGCRDHSTISNHRKQLKGLVFAKHDNEFKEWYQTLSPYLVRPYRLNYKIHEFLNKFDLSEDKYLLFRGRHDNRISELRRRFNEHKEQLIRLRQKIRELEVA